MYSNLSKKEKKTRLAQVCKRAILWSVQQQTISHQRKSTSKNIQSSETRASQQITQRDSTLFQTGHSYFTPIYIPEQNTDIGIEKKAITFL